MIIAFAGRRIDAPNAETVRFPNANVKVVRDRIRAQLEGLAAAVIVASAACGADLLALDAAGELGVRRAIILPWDRARFRAGSVTDHGAEWGPLFDRIIDDAEKRGELHDLRLPLDGNDAYLATNAAIIDTAQDIAREHGDPSDIAVLVAWNGASRGADDVTEQFLITARKRGLEIVEIPTT
jgi:hypothetical protein